MGYQLGIDLGTTYTSAAVCRSDDRHWVEPEVVTLGTRGATVPSVLFLGPDGSVVVGEAAERRAVTDPDRVVREFKRRIGDATPIVVAGRAWAPEELSARLVRWVVDRVAEREGGPAARIAVTHPASWGPHKKDMLGGALAAQGLTVTFLAEPQAAALHYAAAERVEAGSTIAVYDLGGGTFDAAVVRKADPGRAGSDTAGFGLLGRPEGLERLGGIDFDEAVFEHVRDGLPEAFAGLDAADPGVLAAVARVRRDCTEAKEALSSDTEVSIPVLLPGSRGSVRLHRSEFESLIRPQVEETVAALRTAVTSAGLTPEELTAVLLVGGSSRIPLVSQLVSQQLGRPVAVDTDPKNAIAKGAALAVSPKPTASWPGVVIAPVSAAAAAGGRVGAPVGPPPRPPRTPPRGVPPFATPQSYPPQSYPHQSYPPQSYPPQSYPAPRGGPTHEPAAALLSGGSAQPARPPVRRDAEPDDAWRYDDEPAPRRRPIGLLVGVGGLMAVVALIVGVMVFSGGGGDPSGGTIGGAEQTPEVSAPADPAAGTTAPAAPGGTGDTGSDGNTGGTGSGSGTAGGGGEPARPGGTGSPAPGGGDTGGGATTPAPEPPPADEPTIEPSPDPDPVPESVPDQPLPVDPPAGTGVETGGAQGPAQPPPATAEPGTGGAEGSTPPVAGSGPSVTDAPPTTPLVV